MNDLHRGSRSRCLLTWLAAGATTVAAVAWTAPDLAAAHAALTGTTPGAAPSFDAWLTWLCAGAVALCAAWGWLVTSVVVLEVLTGRPRRSPARAVPAWGRRLVLGACGVAVLGSAMPGLAAPGHPVPDRGDRAGLLEGLPLPERAEGRGGCRGVARAIAETPSSEPSGRHRVRPGDSLWSIAEAALRRSGAPNAPADVAAYWPEIYALNGGLVGTDPDLIRPGQLLRLADPSLTPRPGEDLP
jgi:hypothetical protein